MNIKIYPTKLRGTVKVPASKSLSHRAILAAALSSGKSILRNVCYSVDILSTLGAVKALSVDVKVKKDELVIYGGIEKIYLNNKHKQLEINCNDSASTLRFLIPIVAALGLKVRFLCSKRLIERLYKCGTFYCEIFDNYVIVNRKLDYGSFNFNRCFTSQFITGLLLILPILKGESTILFDEYLESRSFIKLTIDFLAKLNIKIEKTKDGFKIEGNQKYSAFDYYIEGDYSLAAFFGVAGCLSKIKMVGLKPYSIQRDFKFIEILKFCGANVKLEEDFIVVKLKTSKMKAFEVNLKDNIDLAPPLVVLGTMCVGISKIGGIFRLSFKESDRIESILSLVRSLGGKIELEKDYFKIYGTGILKGGFVESFNDHRIAMAASIASVCCKESVMLRGSECIDKSYPNFFKDIIKLGGQLEEL